jgi:hypothetical protein
MKKLIAITFMFLLTYATLGFAINKNVSLTIANWSKAEISLQYLPVLNACGGRAQALSSKTKPINKSFFMGFSINRSNIGLPSRSSLCTKL